MDPPTDRPRFDPAVPHQRTREPVTESGLEILARLDALRADFDLALRLIVAALGRYAQQEVRPLELAAKREAKSQAASPIHEDAA